MKFKDRWNEIILKRIKKILFSIYTKIYNKPAIRFAESNSHLDAFKNNKKFKFEDMQNNSHLDAFKKNKIDLTKRKDFCCS